MRVLLAMLVAGCPAPEDATTTPGCDEMDADADGASACEDCDDANPAIGPDAVERCNGVDDDCDGALADGEGDDDGDGTPDCAVCDASGAWLPTRGLTTRAALAPVLSNLVRDTRCDYYGARLQMFNELDNVDGYVTCVYTGARVRVAGGMPDAADLNTEHTWPQSEGADVLPAKCDLHHLFPTDPDANTARGNSPFGEVVGSASWSGGGSRLGRDAAGGLVFEPRDDHKGNVARAMLYFSLRYDKALPRDRQRLFERWSAADPPDVHERARTLGIQASQGSVNPFAACPDLVDPWVE